MAKYNLKVRNGGIELLDTNRMGCVFRLYDDPHSVSHGQFPRVDFPLPAASVASVFGDYTTAVVASTFNDRYDPDKNLDGINFYPSPEKDERYLNLIRGVRITQQLISDGRYISSSSRPLVGCSNSINGANNYEVVTADLPKSAYRSFGKDDLLHPTTPVNAYKLVTVEGYITSQISTYRQAFDPNAIEFNDVGETKEATHAAMRQTMGMEQVANVVPISCSPDEALVVQYRTSGVIVALYHKSISHEICVCVGAHPAELRVHRYTNNPGGKRIPVRSNGKHGAKIKEMVPKFDNRQSLVIPVWVSYSGPLLNPMVSPYKTAVVLSNIWNLVIDRISDQQPISIPAGMVVLPAAMWLDEYRVNYNFAYMIGWESNIHSSYANCSSSFVDMFTDAVCPRRILSDVPVLFAERDETRVMDPTMARNERLYYSNWSNINDVGGYMGVIAYDVQLIGPSGFRRSFLDLEGKIASKDEDQIIVGISREIVDIGTDSPAAFHVIRYLSLDVAGGFHSATMDSHVRKPTSDKDGHAVGDMQFNLTGEPPRGSDIQNWAYHSIVTEVEAGTTNSAGAPVLTNSLTGADLAYADLPDAV